VTVAASRTENSFAATGMAPPVGSLSTNPVAGAASTPASSEMLTEHR
jgi:hypothetical protein